MTASFGAVTVVTPVLDGLLTLPAVLDSLTRQQIPVDWLVVDDGSVDGSCEWLSNQVSSSPAPVRIRVLQSMHRRSGPGAARALALPHLPDSGWVTFVDADDTLDEGALAAWVDSAERMQVDVLLTPQPSDVRGRMAAVLPAAEQVLPRGALWNGETLRPWGVYGKLYRCEFLRAHPEVTFPALPEAEDAAFYLRAVVAADRVGLTAADVPRYRYRSAARASLAAPLDHADEVLHTMAGLVDLVRDAAAPAPAYPAASPVAAGLAAVVLRGLATSAPGSPSRQARRAVAAVLRGALRRPRRLVRRDVKVVVVAAAALALPDPAGRAVARAYVRQRTAAHGRSAPA